ncbi:MAG TPA: hypothetical protein VHY84_00965 [Bryobacteraceae bacterium]|nr:hypothetical protein [Bryobacteraceae bacterium]
MSGFGQPGEFVGRYQGYIPRSSPPDDHCFLPIDNLVQNTGQIGSQA